MGKLCEMFVILAPVDRHFLNKIAIVRTFS